MRASGEEVEEVWAKFQTTGSGIVHEWRYSPEHVHVIFKPTGKFPMPEGDGWWGPWKYTSQYDECDSPSKVSLDDVFDDDSEWWVLIVEQY